MKKIALGLMAIVCACGWLAGRSLAAQQKSRTTAVFSVAPVKKSYSAGEAMLLLLGLKNTGQQAMIADGRFALGSTIRVSVTGPQGKAIDWAGAFEPQVPGFQALDPGNSVTRVVCLNCGTRDPFHYPFSEPGNYTVRLAYVPSDSTAGQQSRFPQAVAPGHALEAAPVELQVTPSAVQFTAEPTKPTFQAGEPVTFTFQLQNRSSEGVLAAYDLPLEQAVKLKVVDGNGQEVGWEGKAGNVVPLLSTVNAGGSVEASYAITPQNLFGTTMRGLAIQKPGRYTAYAVYDLSQPIDVLQGYVGTMPMLIVPGPIAAPPVTFTVAAPATGTSTTGTP